MQLKKITKAFLLVSTVLIILIGITACGDDHAHTFSDWETVTEPTCSSEGLQKRVCECGYVELAAIDTIAHTPTADPAVEATCTTHGKTEGSHCSVCGTVLTAQNETAKLAHSFSAWETVAEATCTSHGLEKRVCACGETEYKATELAAHTPVVDPAIEATCTTHGKTEGSHCGACNAVIVAQTQTDKLAHSFSAWETVAEATCTAHGLEKQVCACGHTEYKATELAAHTPVVDPAVEATCSTHGKTEGSHCGACGAVIVAQTETELLAHGYSDWETVAEATCTSHGLDKRVCACGHTEYKATDKAAHTPVVDPAVEATCTTHGKTEGSHCGACGAVIVAQTETAKLAHSYSEWTTAVEATCNAHGLAKRVCACGHTEYKAIDMLAHTPVVDPAVEATCTTHGKTEGSHCSTCGTVIVAQTEIAKLAHTYSEWQTVINATCHAHGLEERVCACGHTESRAVAALAHTPVVDPAIDPTCTEYGKTEGSHCSACGTVIVAQEIILPYDHDCTQEVIIEKATCDKDGRIRTYCINKNCDHYCESTYSLAEVSAADIYADASKYTGYLTLFDRHGNLLNELMGVVISPDGAIVTSNLAFDNAFSATFRLGEVYYDVTEVLAYSARNNLAVLKIDATDLPYAELCDKTHAAGSTVYTFGDLEGLGATISSGIISNPACHINGAIYVNHDARMDAGFIGGPLVNSFGEVIAINVGYYGEANVSVIAAEINSLNYDNPMTLAEYGALTYSATEQLTDWVHSNYTTRTENDIYYSINGNDFEYALGYNTTGKYPYVKGAWVASNDGAIISIEIIFDDNDDGMYKYIATFVYGNQENKTVGYIDAATFDINTMLTYDTFHGKYWKEAAIMDAYSIAAYDILRWFNYCLTTFTDNLTLESFGFESLEYTQDVDALVKIKIVTTLFGSYNEETGSHVLSMPHENSDGTLITCRLVYTPQSENAPESTIAEIEFLTPDGALYYISLNLDLTENGYRYDALYAVAGPTGYMIGNTTWGYLEPDIFTDTSKLECYEFIGLEDFEDALLADYSLVTCTLLHWMDSLLSMFNISIADLGFLFFGG